MDIKLGFLGPGCREGNGTPLQYSRLENPMDGGAWWAIVRDNSAGKKSAYNAGDPVSIPESGRSPVEGKGYPLQYSCLGNPMNRGAWRL